MTPTSVSDEDRLAQGDRLCGPIKGATPCRDPARGSPYIYIWGPCKIFHLVILSPSPGIDSLVNAKTRAKALLGLDPDPMNASSVDFLALGDWGFVGSGLPNNQSAVADLMGSVAALGRPNFIVSVGDNVYDFGIDVPANASERWNVTWTDVYDAIPELQGIDWYSTFGNHDYGTVAGYCEDKSTNATCEATGGKPWFQVGTVTAPSGSRYFNDFNHHVPFGDKVELFFFNTVPMVTRWREKIDGYRAYKGEPPVDWMAIVDELDASLKASKAPVKIAVTHVGIELGRRGPRSPKQLYAQSPSRSLPFALRALLVHTGEPVYVSSR